MSRFSRLAAAAAMVAGAFFPPAVFSLENRLLLLSAYPTEQAVLLDHARPVTEVGTFNGRRFFKGAIGTKDVVMGLTGIGMVNSKKTTEEAVAGLAELGITVTGIIFSGVAGGPHIGDVMIPRQWRDGGCNVYDVDPEMYSVASTLVGGVLNPYLPVEDAACSGDHSAIPLEPIRLVGDPIVRVGNLGSSSDPYGTRSVPCLSSGGSLLGCEACGAPLNASPGVEKFVSDATPFFIPEFFLFSFSDSSGSCGAPDAVVGDMETAAAAGVAAAHVPEIPFIAFRAASDGPTGDPIFPPGTIGFPVSFFIYQQLAADNAATVVMRFLSLLP